MHVILEESPSMERGDSNKQEDSKRGDSGKREDNGTFK